MKRRTAFIGFWIVVALAATIYAFRPFRYHSRYYDQIDFESSDEPGSGGRMHPDTLRLLDKATELYGEPFFITSAYRTHAKNIDVGGVSDSAHLKGRAIDIDTLPTNHQEILSALKAAGFPRLVIYSGHIHADDDPDKPVGIFYG